MRLKKVMSLFLKAKCSVTALKAKKQCSPVQSSALHCGQDVEVKGKSGITALTALDSAVTLHFANEINGLPSRARGRVLSNDKRALRAPPLWGGGSRQEGMT